MNAGRDFSIKSLQDTDDYSEQSHSAGIAAATGGIAASADKGKINSDYQSTADQSGIYAGKGGFNINVGKNTDLKGAVIDSDAAPDKNKLSTDTLTYSDIANKASYDSKNTGINYNTGKDVRTKDKGLTPDIGTEAKGNVGGTTKSAIAPGTIDIRSNPGQDISGLSRDTKDALNQLSKIFDKEKVKEQQELARLFGEQIFKAIGDLGLKDGSPEKTALDAFAGGLMSKLGGNSFTAGAAGAGINEIVINELAKIKDPAAIQWASAIAGTAAAKVVGGTARTGAGTAVSQTKNNFLSHEQIKMYQDLELSIKNDNSLTEEEKAKKLEALKKTWQEVDDKQSSDALYNIFSKTGGAYSIENDGAVVDAFLFDETTITPTSQQGSSLSENIHKALDLVGFVPVIGSYSEAANSLLYLAEGEKGEAALVALSAIPDLKVVKLIKDGKTYLQITAESKEAAQTLKEINNGKKAADVAKKSDKAASIEDILKGSTESTNGKGIARNFDKSGGFEQTLKDFESLDLDPATVKDIQTQYGPGKVGKLRDGTTVVARPGSNTGGPTLEITVSNSKVYKVRY